MIFFLYIYSCIRPKKLNFCRVHRVKLRLGELIANIPNRFKQRTIVTLVIAYLCVGYLWYFALMQSGCKSVNAKELYKWVVTWYPTHVPFGYPIFKPEMKDMHVTTMKVVYLQGYSIYDLTLFRCWKELKPRPNARNISTQHIATLLCCVVRCCEFAGQTNATFLRNISKYCWSHYDPTCCIRLATLLLHVG